MNYAGKYAKGTMFLCTYELENFVLQFHTDETTKLKD